MKNTLLLMVCCFFVAGIKADNNTTLEPLAGVNMDNGMISIKVKSAGCTTNDSFKIQYTSQHQAIKILRIKPDRCRRMPKYLWLSLPLNTDKSTFTLVNPLQVVD